MGTKAADLCFVVRMVHLERSSQSTFLEFLAQKRLFKLAHEADGSQTLKTGILSFQVPLKGKGFTNRKSQVTAVLTYSKSLKLRW